MWGSRNKRSGSSYSSYDDDDYSSSSYNKDIYDYRDDIKLYVQSYFYCSGDVELKYVDASISGKTIVLKFEFAVYPGAQSWEINDAMSRVVRNAIDSCECPFEVSYSGQVTEYR